MVSLTYFPSDLQAQQPFAPEIPLPSSYFKTMATRKQEDFEGELNVVERPKVAKPRRYHVVFHNDDYTTMEFVVHVLTSFFHKTETEATQVMLEIHHKGHGVAGIYTRDIAETKVAQVGSYAKKHGFPLRCTAEPEGSDKDES